MRGAIPFWLMECNFNLTARTRTELTVTNRADLYYFAVKCWYWSDTNKPIISRLSDIHSRFVVTLTPTDTDITP